MKFWDRFTAPLRTEPDLDDAQASEAATERYFERLATAGIPSPNDWHNPKKKPATTADVAKLYDVNASFVDLLPWVDYLPAEKAMLLEDGVSRAAFFELTPIGTEGRDPEWLRKARDALENALQDSFDELETSPWVVQLYAQDETNWDDYLQQLHDYIQPRAQGTAFTELYLTLMKQHLEAISKPGGLFEDTAVSKLPWKGQQRRVRLVVYRRIQRTDLDVRGQAPGPYLKIICDRLTGGLANAGIKSHRMEPVDPQDEVAPLNTYLRWLPGNFDPNQRRALDWYTQLMFAQHIANLAPVWGRSTGTGHPGITLFNRGGAPLTFDPLNRLDRQMNAHLFIFGPTGSGKSATATGMLSQLVAIYRPRLFIVEAGNSFGLLGDFAKQLGLTVNRVRLAPGSGVSLAPFADAVKLIEPSHNVKIFKADDLEASDEQRDILGEMEITARLMITGGEDKEDARLTRADRSAIRHCILNAAKKCVAEQRIVLPQDIREALHETGLEPGIPAARSARFLEMAEALSMFCMGSEGEMFNRPGTPWPEADITIVDLATYAREGYSAQMAIAYISLLNAVNNIAERDQFKGRPLVFFTDEGHIQLRVPLLSPYSVKITKMWRKLGAWFWMATQNVDDVPPEASALLNMIEWWICLNMPPDEVVKIARFRELSPAQKSMMLSARKESGKFTEGVVLSKSLEMLFRAVPPSLFLALAMTEPEEKKQRYDLMQATGCNELDAAINVAATLDRSRGIEPHTLTFPEPDSAMEPPA